MSDLIKCKTTCTCKGISDMGISDMPLPRWLTMIPSSGECQICKTPEGQTRTYYLNIRFIGNDKSGFLVCGKEECNLFIQTYMKNLYDTIYTSKTWKRILNIYANNLFITIKRTSGDIEHDWVLDNDYDHDSNKIPLATSFIYASLCCNKNDDYANLPSDIWEYMYNLCLETYKDNINLSFSNYNKFTNCLEPNIRVKKGDIYKKVLMYTI